MRDDWAVIRNDYIHGGGSYKTLSKKYDVPYPTLRDRAVREGWKKDKDEKRAALVAKIERKTDEKITNNAAEIAAIQSRLELRLFQQLERRINAKSVKGTEFRRLVQSYIDMCNARNPVPDEKQEEAHNALIDAIREAENAN